MMPPLWLYGGCFVTAVVYAMVGLGGGSMYVALLALTSMNHEAIRIAALAMNVVVSGVSYLSFRSAGRERPRLLIPILLTSLPAAFLGGLLRISSTVFSLLLAATLALVGARMILWRNDLLERRGGHWATPWRFGPIAGAVAGLLAGIVGIGGGVLLGPLLIIAGWSTSKEASTVTAAYVGLNSATGLVAHLARGNHPPAWLGPLLAVVLVGGIAGARLGALRLSPVFVQRLFGVIVLTVACRLVWQALL